MRNAFIALGLALVVASPAAAQIYTWRDAQGTLVLSDHPRAGLGEMTTRAAPAGLAVRAATPLPGANVHRYDDLIRTHAARHGLSPELVRAVIQVESAFDPTAVSPKGAMGLMQLMPATATQFGVTNPFHPDQNIRGGVAYLKQLLTRYDNRVELALAAYNAGPGNVEKYGDVPPFRETQSYVKRITGAVPTAPPTAVYKCVDIVDGQAVVRYSNRPAKTGTCQIVGSR